MRKKSFRKHLKKLATDEERQQAKAERAEQTAKKQQLIANFLANQKKTKKAGNGDNVIKKTSEGMQLMLTCAVGWVWVLLLSGLIAHQVQLRLFCYDFCDAPC